MKKTTLMILALSLAACGGGEGGDDKPSAGITAPVPAQPAESSDSGGSGSSGSGSSSSSGSDDSSDDSIGNICVGPYGPYYCGTLVPNVVDHGPQDKAQTAWTEFEWNNDLDSAQAVFIRSPEFEEQRVGFVLKGDINAVSDPVDFFSFTPPRTAVLQVNLCDDGVHCLLNAADPEMSINRATIRIIDQNGNEIVSANNKYPPHNELLLEVHGGVLYYVAVVGEGFADATVPYRLSALEGADGPGGADNVDDSEPPLTAPHPPELSAFVLDSDYNVQFDWTVPLYNMDGSQVTDLAEYHILIKSHNGYENLLVATIQNSLVTTITLPMKDFEGEHAVIVACNISGACSNFSNEVLIESAPADPAT